MKELSETLSKEVFNCPVCGTVFIKSAVQEYRNRSISGKKWRHCPICGEELNMEVLYDD